MNKNNAWIYDDTDGAFPVEINVRVESGFVYIENAIFKIRIETEAIMKALSDEKHG